MKIVLDMNLSPAWIPFLKAGGHEVKHWSDIGVITATDIEIMEWARNNDYIVFTHDKVITNKCERTVFSYRKIVRN